MTLRLNWTRERRNGKPIVTVRDGDDVLHVEKVDLFDPAARAKLAGKATGGRPQADAAALEGQLQDLAAELAADNGDDDGGEPADFGSLPEIDASRIIRPERFIAPELSGLAVPTMTTLGDKVAGRWVWYLRWADGKRERRPLGSTLDLPDGGRLYVHPVPATATPNMRPGWSADARKRWLEGEAAPDPAELFKRLAERFAHFLDVPKAKAPGVTATLVCWTMLSYVYQVWPAVPYLYLGGPAGSGKTRTFEILTRLVWRPLASSNMTAASLFRTLHASGGTLLLDEAERLKQARDPDVGEILSMLLAGYKAGACAMRLEPVGESGFKTVAFDVYGPKAMACIAGLPPALASRCITITMFRAAPGSEKPKRRIDGDPSGWQGLRDGLHSLALEHGLTWLELANRSDVVPGGLSGRDYELWQPLLALAAWLESSGANGLLGLLQEHALVTAEAGQDDQTPDHDETLLRLLAEAVRTGERPKPGELLDRAKQAEPEAFKRWSAKAVSQHLKRYNLATNKTHGERRYGRIALDDLRQIQTSYGIDLGFEDG